MSYKIPPMVTCECRTWASDDVRKRMLGNGHHENCPHFIPLLGAADLLKGLVEGMESWAADTDGIHPEAWEAYRQAVYITRGQVLDKEKP